MRVHLEYGRTGLDVELPDHAVVRTLSYKSVPPLSDPDSGVARSSPESHRFATFGPTGLRPSRCVHLDLRCDAAGAQRDDAPPHPPHPGGQRHRPREDSDFGRHGPASAQRRRRIGGNGGPVHRRELPDRKPPRPEVGRTHLLGRQSARRADLARYAVRPGRPEDHRRLDRAAFHGRFFRGTQTDLSGHRGLGDHQGLAQSRVPGASPRRLGNPRRQSRARREHVDRPPRGLRFHRQRGDRLRNGGP